MRLELQGVPQDVRDGDNGAYGDVEAWIASYLETGRHDVDFTRIQKQNLEAVEIWARDKTNWEFELGRHAHGVTN